MPTQAGSAGERGEAGKRKNDCDTQQDTERLVETGVKSLFVE